MRLLIIVVILILPISAKGQNTIEWEDHYLLQLSDFRSPTSQIGNTTIYSLHSSAGMNFYFQMSSAEFMFTKNFNSKVDCSFKRDAASLIAPDSLMALDLLLFARFEFDLSELYARKFREKLYEAKGAFSNVNFIRPVYDQIQKEYTERHAEAAKVTDLGRDREKLKLLHDEVLMGINELSAFCKSCKPTRKKE